MKNLNRKHSIIIVSLLVAVLFLIVAVFSNVKYASADVANNVTVEEQNDLNILKNKKEPNINDEFELNKINIILKSKYSHLEEICLDALNINAELFGITYLSNSANKVENSTTDTIKLSKSKNQVLTLGLEQSSKESILNIIKELQKNEFILTAEPIYNYDVEKEWIPEDSYYERQWSLSKDNGINMEEIWDFTRGDSNIRVGIFEEAINVDHADLAGRVVDSNFIPNEDVDFKHGTEVAGIIGAKQDKKGIAGISQSELVLLNPEDFVESIVYAQEHNIKVINASFRYVIKGTQESAPANMAHFAALQNFDGLVVCSAGNNNLNTDVKPQYPACYDLPNIISVGAINKTDEKCNFSNYGLNRVDIYAPGYYIYTTSMIMGNNDAWLSVSGTSYAAPHVSGIASLMLSVDPTLTGVELRNLILDNSIEIEITLSDGNKQNVKKFNAYGAVKCLYVFKYNKISETDIKISGLYDKLSGGIDIPKKIHGLNVVAIDDFAFINQENLTKVTIPASVKSIGYGTFEHCDNLQTVIVEEGSKLNNIGDFAFAYCAKLNKVGLANSSEVVNITANTFKNVADDIHFYVHNNQISRYLQADCWSQYTNKLSGVYFEGYDMYTLNSTVLPASYYMDVITCYEYEFNENLDGFLTEEFAEIWVGLNIYYAKFYTFVIENYSDYVSIDLVITLSQEVPDCSCLLMDSERNIIERCYVENKVLFAPIYAIAERQDEIFYLYPEENEWRQIHFTIDDAEIVFTYKVYI